MSLDTCAQAWSEARQSNQSCFAIVEVGLLPDQKRLQLLQSDFTRRPLMLQPEFAELRNHGPWLLDVSHLDFEAFLAHEYFTGCEAVTGWIRTHCPPDKLATHLSDALLAKNDAGEVLLIRSYAPEVLPLLYARNDMPWHPWLFGPMHEWWLPTTNVDWQCLKGSGFEQPTDYQPITLDADLWKAMEVDPLAYSLTTELEKSAPEVFTSTCHDDRLTQVKQALATGRDEGFEESEDVSLFATLQLMDHEFPATWPQWPQAKDLVRDEKLPLGIAMRQLSE
ncbi:DUF4123 domain-containing protein [Pseudomonas sp. UYIF39]|uniref:DUF4123 domain-containing protein n=1 Tax=Pseudomonas sp. UYIF39 TaxID=1630747 RepID=UPI00249F354D|nr:DUF4123 domain-containing protein [Pseudomonas sp. UYIF39]MDI3353168.1 DUF4123 domain-containing protein [Pseudomonas sp. UYIF39]